MHRLKLAGSAVVVMMLVLTIVGVAPRRALAHHQEGTPAAECDAPELPPGTPTPMEEESAATPAEGDPEGGDAAEEEGEEPFELATPEGAAAADEAGAAAATTAIEGIIACVASGDFQALGALMTERFIVEFLEVPTVYDVPSTLEGAAPFDVVSLDNVQVYADGSYSVDFVYGGFFNGPGGLTSERWFFVDDSGVLKVDNITQVPLPEGVLPGALIVEVHMVDYAFALSQTTLPANTPIIFRVTNESASGAGHVAVVLTYPDGTAAASLITGETDIEASTGFFGALYLEPGQSGDFGVTGLEPGAYFLACDVTTPDGTPHHDLGMVSQITVE